MGKGIQNNNAITEGVNRGKGLQGCSKGIDKSEQNKVLG